MEVLKATLYVKGIRITQVDDRSQKGYVGQFMTDLWNMPTHLWPDYKVYKETVDKSVLPIDQKALILTVKALAIKYGFELRVIDVTEKPFLRGLKNRLKGISVFPTLLTDTGVKIEGNITEERIKTLLGS